MARAFNFNAGPAVMPEDVLREAQADLLDFKGSGMSIMEHSHRGKEYDAVHQEAIANVRKLMNLPEDYVVLLLPGGASQQFAMVPLNLLREGQVADYANCGAWASKAVKEAKIVGKVNVLYDTSKDIPTRVHPDTLPAFTPGAAYVHITSNETIAGAQWKTFPKTEAPLVADMSSDILSRPFDMRQFGLIYAGAQKNLGPAGLALVVMRKDLVGLASDKVPMFFRYATHLEENSLYNTPPTFGIYILTLTTRWLLKLGGVDGIAARNRAKAAKVYAAIDGSGGYYKGCSVKDQRSDMNITFRLPTEPLEEAFVKEASALKMKGLKGHRSVGGLRASIYNAFPEAGIDALVEFMKDFQRRNG
jgi:phosphoserine aminotransferase